MSENNNYNWSKTRFFTILMSLTLLSLIAALLSYAALNFTKRDFVGTSLPTISVAGEGYVETTPDLGEFFFTVKCELRVSS